MDLFTIDVTNIPGVGPARANRLAHLQIRSVGDLFYYFPFRYEHVHAESEVLEHSAQIVVEAVVCGAASVRIQGRRSTISVPVQVGASTMQALFFNQTFLRHQLLPGKRLRLSGKFQEQAKKIIVSRYEWIKPGSDSPLYIPIYRLTKDLTQVTFRGMIQDALRVYVHELEDLLPVKLRERFKLCTLGDAFLRIHRPKSAEDIRQSRRRLVFEEFLHFQLQVQSYRHMRKQARQMPIKLNVLEARADKFIEHLPFTLTNGQAHAIRQILPELASARPMHRLLQGDVGSGKTAVAFTAIAAIAGLGFQSAYMVPTGILALQQFDVAQSWLEQSGVRVGLLVGGQDVKERKRVMHNLEIGEIDLVIGTHVLASGEVHFKSLRLIVTDEQHRFGVTTRKLLRSQTFTPDVLQMTATPIPRTLALTLFGDIAVTSIRDLPPSRKPIQTHLFSLEQEAKVIQIIRAELARGRQAYLVAPRIDSDEASSLTSAEELYERLSEELAGWTIGVLHGGLQERERTQIMTDFVSGQLSILIATTIIEVGVSVPNASMMVIYNADRFGIATLHQLRGRVGRGRHASHCVLIANPVTESGQARLDAMLKSQDGFVLAQQDLILRGPGELLGDRQSGLPVFRAGELIRDSKIMEVARNVASELLSANEFWLLPSYRGLRVFATAIQDQYLDS